MGHLAEGFGQISVGVALAYCSGTVSIAFVYSITIDDLAVFLYATRGAIGHCGMVADEQPAAHPRLREAHGRIHEMGSRHMDSSPTLLSAIQQAASYAAGGAGKPPDLASLLAVAERVLGTWDGVGDRLQREADALTQHRAVLRLHSAERARGVRSELPADARLHRVEFVGRIYGTLAILPDSQDPSMPALPDSQAQQLARVCGVLLCLLEQGALLRVLSQHLAPEPLQPLTQRQREVLALIARGLSDDEIVDELHISPETMRRHRYDMYARLGIHDAHDLLLAAYQYGLVSYTVPDA